METSQHGVEIEEPVARYLAHKSLIFASIIYISFVVPAILFA